MNATDRFREALAARKAQEKRRARSVVPEATLGLTAIALAMLAIAANNPREADQALTAIAELIAPPRSPGIDMETTASISRRSAAPSLVDNESLQTGAQEFGQRDGSASARIDIDMGEDTLRGSL